jgi:hypothetical protein
MTIPPARIEAAARAMQELDWFVIEDAERFEEAARIVLTAAFPDLASGEAWVAPHEASDAMRLAFRWFSGDELNEYEAWRVYRDEAMREAHLKDHP